MIKIPKYKKWLSHFVDVNLEAISTEYNPTVRVVLSKGRIRLDAEKSIYSFGDLYESFATVFSKLKWDKSQPKKVLVLGGGFLSIPQLLRPLLHDQTHYSVVEIDDEVIRLSRKYLSPFLHTNVEIECADAASFIYQNPAAYDLICVDVFEDDLVPVSLRNAKFLKALQESLAHNGRLIFSTLTAKSVAEREAQMAFEDQFLSIYKDSEQIKTRGNRMYVYSQ